MPTVPENFLAPSVISLLETVLLDLKAAMRSFRDLAEATGVKSVKQIRIETAFF